MLHISYVILFSQIIFLWIKVLVIVKKKNVLIPDSSTKSKLLLYYINVLDSISYILKLKLPNYYDNLRKGVTFL